MGLVAPETSARSSSLVLSKLEAGFHGSVKWVAGDAPAVAGSDQFFIKAPVVEIDVGEKSLIAVAFFAVEFELDDLAFNGPFCERGRLGTKRFHRFGRMFCLGRVDADQPNSLVVLQNERVAVNNSDYSPLFLVLRDGLRRKNRVDLVLDAIPDSEPLQQEDRDSQNDNDTSGNTTRATTFSSQGSAFLNRSIREFCGFAWRKRESVLAETHSARAVSREWIFRVVAAAWLAQIKAE